MHNFRTKLRLQNIGPHVCVLGHQVDFQGGHPTIYILASAFSGYFLFPHFCSHQINWLGLQRPTIANKRGKCVKKFIHFIPPTTSSRNRKQRSVIYKSIFLKQYDNFGFKFTRTPRTPNNLQLPVYKKSKD